MLRNQWGHGYLGVQKEHYMKHVEADLKARALDGVAAIYQISLTLIVTFLFLQLNTYEKQFNGRRVRLGSQFKGVSP